MSILVVEDDPDLARLLEDTFQMAGRRARVCMDGAEGLEAASGPGVEAVVLDAMLPTFSGFEVCQRLRERGVAVPVIMLTCCDREDDILRGFRVGADDYVTKPFSTAQLLARIDALMRRSAGQVGQRRVTCGPVSVDRTRRAAICAGAELTLTAREFDLLAFFLDHAGRAVTRETLLARVWGDDGQHTMNVVDVYVGYLRRKLAAAGGDGCLRTMRGFGYIFDTPG